VLKSFIIAIVGSLLFALPVHAQKKQSDREHDGLLGQVQTVRWEGAIVTNLSGKIVSGSPELLWMNTYDLQGNLIERNLDNGERSVFSYDSNGNKTSKEYTRDDGEQSSLTGSKKKSGGVRLGDGTVVYSRIYKYKYDSKGLRTEESIHTDDGSLIERTRYSYDAKGNRKESFNSIKGGSQVAKATFTYDGAGNPTKRVLHIEINGGLGGLDSTEFYDYEFDSTGNWIKRITSRRLSSKSLPVPLEVTYRIIKYYEVQIQ
jgi:YD repeat-containing protein